MRYLFVILILVVASCVRATVPSIPPFGYYPLVFTTYEERNHLQEESLVRVKPERFIRVNPEDFNVKIGEDEKLIDVINKILPVITKESVLPEYVMLALVKTNSVHQVVFTTKKTLKSQIDKIDLPVSPGDIVLITPR